jgi:sugar-specific transcriptional regulator TrmB
LTEYEARTLIALVRLGTGTARGVANVDGVPRSRVHDAAETLHERGFVDVR